MPKPLHTGSPSSLASEIVFGILGRMLYRRAWPKSVQHLSSSGANVSQNALVSEVPNEQQFSAVELHLQETPNSVGVRKPMYRIQATVAYETATGQVRHYRKCSSRSLFLEQEAAPCLLIRTSYQNLIPGHLREFQNTVKEGPSYPFFNSIPEELSYKQQCVASSRS